MAVKSNAARVVKNVTHRAYSKFVIKAIDEERRIITGIATTPTADRMGDVVEPKGAKFSLPIPFLWQHQSSQPIGNVTKAKVTKDGIEVEVQLESIDEPGTLKDRLDEAWQSIKIKLVRGLSIGFSAIEYSYMDDYSVHFLEWDWLELSAVTIPANSEATISSIKSFDKRQLAASGAKRIRTPILLAGVSAQSGSKKVTEVKISEQLKQLREQRAQKAARMSAIQQKSADEGRGKTEQEREEFLALADELKSIDEEISDCELIERANVQKAVPITTVGDGTDDDGAAVAAAAAATRARAEGNGRREKGVPGVQTIALRKELPPGILFARYVKCVGASRGDLGVAAMLAKLHYADTPQIANVIKAGLVGGMINEAMKAAVTGGTTTDATWAGPLLEYTQFAGDFIEYLRPQTILGKFGTGNIPGLRAVPFNIHIRGQTSGGNGYWVGQGKPKPLTKFDFEDVYLGFSKVANIAVLTEELLRFSSPSADTLTRDALAAALIERLDIDFVDPAKAAVANVSPASITNGITPLHGSGIDERSVRADIGRMLGRFISANLTPTSAVWIMSASLALQLSLMTNALGNPSFPLITMNGGTFLGIPVITSQYVPNESGGFTAILVNAQDVWLADDGSVTVDASREASLQMLDNPTNASSDGTATSMVSMFQTNSIALRAERYINWKRRRDSGVVVMDDIAWGAHGGDSP